MLNLCVKGVRDSKIHYNNFLTKLEKIGININEDFMKLPVYIIIISNRDFAP